MTKEELFEIKNMLRTKERLSQEDRLELEKLLSDYELLDGTGFPTIDKPWIKFYNQYEYSKTKPKNTVYQEIYNNNVKYVNDLAIQFFGSNINYKTLFKKIDQTAKSLIEYGIKKGDFVTICSAGIPEIVYTFYALSKIGAVANFMSPYFDKNHMVDRINDCCSDTLIVMDKCYEAIKESVSKSTIKKVIVIPTLNSSILSILPNKDMPKLNYATDVLWNQFIKDGKKKGEIEAVAYEKDAPLCMVYSSGTTGASKAILLSNDSFQNSVQSYPASGVDITRGQKFYQIIPPWFSTGLSTSIHLPLSYGVSVLMDPRFERKIFVNNVVKYKPNYAVAPTSMYEGFLDENLIGNKKVIGFNYPFEGGEPLSKEVASKIETQLKKHGTDTKLRAAYGQCECGACITTQTQKINHPDGSVGIPIPGVTIGVFDEDNNELHYYERGEIRVDTPCGMLEYYKNPTATEEYFYVDSNGKKWSCTGDIGYIDPNGDLFIEGRMSDYTMVSDKKVYNFDIEKILLKEFDVKNCDVLPVQSENGQKLAAHIILDDSAAISYSKNSDLLLSRLEQIRSDIYEQLGDVDMVPVLFKIRTEFPYKLSGKRDTESMKSEASGFIDLGKYQTVIKKIK